MVLLSNKSIHHQYIPALLFVYPSRSTIEIYDAYLRANFPFIFIFISLFFISIKLVFFSKEI